MSTRYSNQKRFKQWKQTEQGGRVYYRQVQGKTGWYAFYYKEVDNNETTLSLWQEIYNNKNELVEIHHKYPEDKGHQKIK